MQARALHIVALSRREWSLQISTQACLQEALAKSFATKPFSDSFSVLLQAQAPAALWSQVRTRTFWSTPVTMQHANPDCIASKLAFAQRLWRQPARPMRFRSHGMKSGPRTHDIGGHEKLGLAATEALPNSGATLKQTRTPQPHFQIIALIKTYSSIWSRASARPSLGEHSRGFGPPTFDKNSRFCRPRAGPSVASWKNRWVSLQGNKSI